MIFIPGKPRGKGRPRFTRGGGVYTDPQTKAYEQKIASEYHRSGGALFEDVPVKLFIADRLLAFLDTVAHSGETVPIDAVIDTIKNAPDIRKVKT